ncbi:hypothetical protein [Vagococcus elongatus]
MGVHQADVQWLIKAKILDFLIIDCMRASEMLEEYRLGEFPIVEKNEAARLIE